MSDDNLVQAVMMRLLTPRTIRLVHRILVAEGHKITRDETCQIVWDLERIGRVTHRSRNGRRMYLIATDHEWRSRRRTQTLEGSKEPTGAAADALSTPTPTMGCRITSKLPCAS